MTTGRIGRRELLGGSLLLGAATAVPGLHVAAADLKGEISVAYSATYVFGVDAQAVEWWNSIKQQFEENTRVPPSNCYRWTAPTST